LEGTEVVNLGLRGLRAGLRDWEVPGVVLVSIPVLVLNSVCRRTVIQTAVDASIMSI
jgi:hypothetical protein